MFNIFVCFTALSRAYNEKSMRLCEVSRDRVVLVFTELTIHSCVLEIDIPAAQSTAVSSVNDALAAADEEHARHQDACAGGKHGG